MAIAPKVYRPRSITAGMALRRAIAVIDNSPELTAIAHALTASTGRPRKLPFRAVFIGFVLHAILDGTNMHKTEVADRLSELDQRHWPLLGITEPVAYQHVQRAEVKFRRRARAGIRIPDPDQPDRTIVLTLDDITCLIAAAGIPPGFDLPSTVALDGMDYETSARPGEYVDTTTGEIRASADPDARVGHRTRTVNHASEWFTGFELHLLTSVPDRPTRKQPLKEHPHVVRGMALRPGVTDRRPAGASLVLREARRNPVTECVADRGYSHATLAAFRLPLLEAGIGVVMDLHTQQRSVRDASVAGVLLVDGHPFVAALPGHLRELTPPAIGDTPKAKALAHEKYEARKQYALTPHGKVDPVTGRQRFRGPALRGHVRCPNDPASARMSRKVPKTACEPGQPCACSKVVTLGPEDDLQTRQRDLYGTPAWKASYSRRVGIESTNAEIRNHRANMTRGYTQVTGLAGTGILLAFGFAGLNVRILHDWHEIRGLADPWATLLDEPPDTRPRQRRVKKVRKPTLLERLTSGTDPPPGPRRRH